MFENDEELPDEGEELETPDTQGVGYTLEDFEAIDSGDQSGADPDSIKLEGEKIPERFRGKSLSDILKENAQLEQQARLAVLEQRKPEPAPVAPRAPEPPPEPELTREQLQEMYDNDPLAAIEAMQAQALRNAERSLAGRLGALEAGTVGATENWARTEFADEFELFGDKIEQFKNSLPNKAVLTTKQGWKDMISYIRGQDENFEALLEHRAGRPRPSSKTARKAQAASAGFSGGGTRRSSSNSRGGVRLSADQREAAQGLGISEAEYARWNNIK